MPVSFKPKQVIIRQGRGGAFDQAVLKLVRTIKGLQRDGVCDILAMAAKLNEMEMFAPSGKPFSFGTMRRILHRLAELELIQRPRTKSEVAKLPRTYRGYTRKAIAKISW